jgi:hypothetical protein
VPGVGGGIGGGTGGSLSDCRHDERSKNMNSSALACGDIGDALQPPGNGVPGSELSPPVETALTSTFVPTCRSVKTTRPHWFSGVAACSTGVAVVDPDAPQQALEPRRSRPW